MRQKYKVFSENSLIYISDSIRADVPSIKVEKIRDVESFEEMTKNGPVQLLSRDPKNSLDSLFSSFKPIKAAGGVVVCQGHILLIERFGRWDFPKGKIEKGENVEDAAKREVQEECGIGSNLFVKGPIENTFHVYGINEHSMIKETSWFHMETEQLLSVSPQMEEGITDVKWVPRNLLGEYVTDSFLLVQEIARQFYG